MTTSNKQLNFVQHIKTILDINGRAGVVLPDNVLFEGGAGETLRKSTVEVNSMSTHCCDLPTGIFYAGGVKANVLFFEKRPAADTHGRRNCGSTTTDQPALHEKQNPLAPCAHRRVRGVVHAPGRPRSERVEAERFKSFTYEELVARDKANLDLIWLKDDSLTDAADLPAPEVLAREIIEELEAALEGFKAIAESIEDLAASDALRPPTSRWDNAPGDIVITKRGAPLGDESRWHGEAKDMAVTKKNDDPNYKGPST